MFLAIRKKAQSTLEYILILTAIVTALLIAVGTYIKPAIQNGTTGYLDQAANLVNNSASKLPTYTP